MRARQHLARISPLHVKRIVSFLLAAVLITACAGSEGSTANNTPPTAAATAAEPTATTALSPTVEPSATMQTPAGAGTDTPAAPVETGTPTEQPPAASVTSFPDPAGFAWNPVIEGLNKPLDLASPPDGSGRLFILEQPGTIRIVEGGVLLAEPFLDITDKVQSGGNEQGLLGIAFHPQYGENGFFYINYTGLEGIGDTVIARYQAQVDDPNRANPDSEMVMLKVPQPYANHNGGGLAFGPDGFLYIGLGDGGSAGDPQDNAQSTETLLGKLLRVDVNGGEPYAIPADNPFANGGGEQEIWAYGLRNPWRFSFDELTGDLYIADVGQNEWEEINFQPEGTTGGVNYGWDYREGAHEYESIPPEGLVLVDPIYEYQHGFGCSVTGGYVYRGGSLPEFHGIYLFADYCTGRVWGLLPSADGSWQVEQLFQNQFNISSFGIDAEGELYLIDQSGGTVYRLERM